MDTRTGQIVPQDIIDAFSPGEAKYYVPVQRDLTPKEQFTRQIDLYAPCGCGSGKKFKFCCKAKPVNVCANCGEEATRRGDHKEAGSVMLCQACAAPAIRDGELTHVRLLSK